MIDTLDREMIEWIKKIESAKVSDVIRPFLNRKSNSALRSRIRVLFYEGYIELEKQPSCVLVKFRRESEATPSDSKQRGEPQYV